MLICLAGLFFSACSPPKKGDLIVGNWVEVGAAELDSTQTAKEVVFLANGTDNKFIAKGWYPENIEGTWIRDKADLELRFTEPKRYDVDSIVVKNDGTGGSLITLYEEENVASSGINGEILSSVTTKHILIGRLNEHDLVFQIGGVSHTYSKLAEEERGISLMSVVRGIFGIMALLVITFLFSGNKKRIDWGLVLKGTALQIVIAILVLKVPFVEGGFNWISEKFVQLIGYTNNGIDFLFGEFGFGQKLQPGWFNFAIKVLPTIIFFSALMSALYYLGVLQKVVYAFAWIMKKFMRLSGAESLAAAGNVFLGQTESPLLVKPYLLGMTKSEMMCLMTGGMATIAGGVLAAYVNFLGGDDPVQQAFFAKHLLTASIISAPAAIVAAKILVPETEEINENLEIDKQKIGTNLLEAISNGTSDGLKLAVNVGAMLLVFIALMALGNGILGWTGDVTGLNNVIAENTPYQDGLSFQFLLGYIGAPIVWLIGVDSADMVAVGELLGQKTVLNEFIAYPRLGEMREAGVLSQKSVIISTYMLCGFANFASIGIQIGGIGSLIPSRKGLLSKLGMKALLGGTIASLLTAAIVGMLY